MSLGHLLDTAKLSSEHTRVHLVSEVEKNPETIRFMLLSA